MGGGCVIVLIIAFMCCHYYHKHWKKHVTEATGTKTGLTPVNEDNSLIKDKREEGEGEAEGLSLVIGDEEDKQEKGEGKAEENKAENMEEDINIIEKEITERLNKAAKLGITIEVVVEASKGMKKILREQLKEVVDYTTERISVLKLESEIEDLFGKMLEEDIAYVMEDILKLTEDFIITTLNNRMIETLNTIENIKGICKNLSECKENTFKDILNLIKFLVTYQLEIEYIKSKAREKGIDITQTLPSE